jgi:hypothetical protein
MPRKAKPLAQFNASYYTYPNSIRSGKYPLEADLSRYDQEDRRKWLARVADHSHSQFHRFLNENFSDPSDWEVLKLLLYQHGIFAERFFHRGIRERVTRQFVRAEVNLQHLEELLSSAWKLEFQLYNESDAIYRIVDYIFEQTLARAISNTRVYRQLEKWFQ